MSLDTALLSCVILSEALRLQRSAESKGARASEASRGPHETSLNRGKNKKYDANRRDDKAAEHFPILLDRTEIDARKALSPE